MKQRGCRRYRDDPYDYSQAVLGRLLDRKLTEIAQIARAASVKAKRSIANEPT